MTLGILKRPNNAMIWPIPIRRLLVLVPSVLLAACAAEMRGQIPQPSASKPSAAIPAASSLPVAPPAGVSEAPVPPAPAHVEVKYAEGRLSVAANNASLNQILREVAQKTGMKITGGVADERVFGDYGPAAPATILAALLEGTGNNMLLVNDVKGPSTLVLTPRRGGVTPPNPSAAREESAGDEDGGSRYVPPTRPFQPPTFSGRGPVSTNADGSPSATPASPPENGEAAEDQLTGGNPTRTPQQIYDQLVKQAVPPSPPQP